MLAVGLKADPNQVLILVLVDVGLGPAFAAESAAAHACLNPCFSGCWSRTSTV